MRAAQRAFIASLLGLSALAVYADVYTWTDSNGRVQYSDHPPKNFKGEVRRIEPDEKPAPAAVVAKPAPKAEAPTAAPVKKDMAGKRHDDRERLAGDVAAAREKLSQARKALAEKQEPQVDERHIVMRPGGAAGSVPMPGVVPAASRSNCREQVSVDGKKSLVCPVSMPNEAYFERISGLEAAVKAAEEDLATAERAYRRGVD